MKYSWSYQAFPFAGILDQVVPTRCTEFIVFFDIANAARTNGFDRLGLLFTTVRTKAVLLAYRMVAVLNDVAGDNPHRDEREDHNQYRVDHIGKWHLEQGQSGQQIHKTVEAGEIRQGPTLRPQTQKILAHKQQGGSQFEGLDRLPGKRSHPLQHAEYGHYHANHCLPGCKQLVTTSKRRTQITQGLIQPAPQWVTQRDDQFCLLFGLHGMGFIDRERRKFIEIPDIK